MKFYSTEVSRTKESATAFLYPILKSLGRNYSEEYEKIKETDSQTLFCIKPEFCVRNCTEKNPSDNNSTEKLDNSVIKKAMKYVEDLVPYLLANKSDLNLYKEPNQIGDGLMTYFCHNFALPCIEDENHSKSCINERNLTEFLTFIKDVILETSKWHQTKNTNLFLIYGFLMNMFSDIESTNSTEKMTLFSGHDSSILAISIALGFFEGRLPSFASRIIFENYWNKNTNKNFMRIIYDGRDVTGLTEFCKDSANNCLKLSANFNLIDSKQFSLYIKHKFESNFQCK